MSGNRPCTSLRERCFNHSAALVSRVVTTGVRPVGQSGDSSLNDADIIERGFFQPLSKAS
jgi:hypothetical protein